MPKLTTSEVKNLFKQFDDLADPKAMRSAILEKISKGFGNGPFEQDGVLFKIVERKINGTDETRLILKYLEPTGEPTKL